jgi:NAD(P)-dependent dehydrogenase (short-subunit alcohol dehydrogenase family)
MSELAGKTALITGASRGIGAAAAEQLVGAGVNVVLAARSTHDLDDVARRIRDAGGRAVSVTCDVSSNDAVQAAVAACINEFGTIDILINNAAVIEPIGHLADTDPDDWGRAMDINIKGVYYGIRAAIPHMVKSGSGTIINISSGAATSALEGWSAYCTTKAAVLMLTKSVHQEYAGKGIRCIGLSPGTVATNMQVVIKASGLNPVSQLEWSDHIPPEWPGRAIVWMCTGDAAEFDGGDVSLREEAIRRRVGLV